MELMDESDNVAEDSGAPAWKCQSEPGSNPAHRILDKMSVTLPRTLSRLRNKSVDSVAKEIHRMDDRQINKQWPRHILTRAWTHSRAMSATTQCLPDVGERPPEEVQGWVGTAKSELPVTIDSTNTVHKTLPALRFGSSYEELGERPECEHGEEPEAEDAQESYALHKDCTLQYRSYTEPLVEWQDCNTDPEHLPQKQPVYSASPDYEFTTLIPLERAVNRQTFEFERPVESMAQHDPEQEMELGLETFKPVMTLQPKFSLSRKSSIVSQHTNTQSPLSSSSSEL